MKIAASTGSAHSKSMTLADRRSSSTPALRARAFEHCLRQINPGAGEGTFGQFDRVRAGPTGQFKNPARLNSMTPHQFQDQAHFLRHDLMTVTEDLVVDVRRIVEALRCHLCGRTTRAYTVFYAKNLYTAI